MHIRDFKYQEKSIRKKLLFENGVYLASRRMGALVILLFQVHGFYAEVYVDEHEESVGHIRAFENTDLLHPYLSQVDLSLVAVNA
jgi:hypothetical protein